LQNRTLKRRLTGIAIWLSLSGTNIGLFAWADCMPQPMTVVLATPFSSRIDRVEDTLQAVLNHTVPLPNGQILPAGTMLKGQVSKLQHATAHTPGKILIRFSKAVTVDGTVYPISAMPATPDGWLQPSDADTSVWHVSPTRSTRLLTERIQRRLGTNRAVWAQILGINENIIPDPSTDEFMVTYNRHDVLAGAGDTLQLTLSCP
jgi:hypothetical protein